MSAIPPRQPEPGVSDDSSHARRPEEQLLAGVYRVHKRFGGVQALRDVTLELHAGEVHCLVGENGAGKSTLVQLLAGVYQPDQGQVRLGRKGRRARSPVDALRQGVSTIFQELTLVPDMSISENLFLGREPVRGRLMLNRAERDRQARTVLKEMGFDTMDPKALVRDLGIAHQQIVEIAKAVSRRKERVIIMDEPTAALTTNESDALFHLIRQLRNRGLAILYITHRLEELNLIADVVTVMRDGKIVLSAPRRNVDRQRLIEAMVGRRIAEMFPRRATKPGEIILDVRNASVGNKVKNVSLSVRRGEVVAVFGLVGAGRTELVEAIVGAQKLSEGDILVKGNTCLLRTPRHALSHGIAFVPEDRKRQGLLPEMNVATNICVSILKSLSRVGYLTGASLVRYAAEYVRGLRIGTPTVTQAIKNLSGGNQQKAILARGLAANPDTLILDEPTRGVDVGARRDLYKLINHVCEDGRGVLMVTSEVTEAIGMSDRIITMRQGRVMGEVDARTATESAIMRLAFGAQDSKP